MLIKAEIFYQLNICFFLSSIVYVYVSVAHFLGNYLFVLSLFHCIRFVDDCNKQFVAALKVSIFVFIVKDNPTDILSIKMSVLIFIFQSGGKKSCFFFIYF